MRSQKNILRGITVPFLFLFTLSCPLIGFSQDFPTKPITIYCGFEAGATTDLTARALAEAGQKIFGVPVVVENKAGGGSTVAASLVASKKPDGYTLAVVASSAMDVRHIMLAPPYNPAKDFTFLMVYGNYVGGICVLKESPFKTLNDLLDHARKNPGSLSYSSSGIGANQQLAVDYLAKQAKVSFKHVPFKGGAPASTALIGKHVDFTAGAGIHLNYVKQGIFRMLAVTSAEQRDPEFPEVPSLKDLGYQDLPPQQYLLLAPKGLPAPISKKLEDSFRQAVHSAEFKKVMKNLSVPFSFKDRRQLEADFPGTYKFYDDLLKEIGIKTKK
ncbi:MAG: tripartite tricarboxylate transporter substrate binding protein [Deltaproteobacteria bacterium]|nr:tripartite tricarboxylate transporter substrate binding protein [Deltaproteobacteria bacterium]